MEEIKAAKCANPVKQFQLGQSIGVNGTPAIVWKVARSFGLPAGTAGRQAGRAQVINSVRRRHGVMA
jgi:hypothetical protein